MLAERFFQLNTNQMVKAATSIEDKPNKGVNSHRTKECLDFAEWYVAPTPNMKVARPYTKAMNVCILPPPIE